MATDGPATPVPADPQTPPVPPVPADDLADILFDWLAQANLDAGDDDGRT